MQQRRDRTIALVGVFVAVAGTALFGCAKPKDEGQAEYKGPREAKAGAPDATGNGGGTTGAAPAQAAPPSAGLGKE